MDDKAQSRWYRRLTPARLLVLVAILLVAAYTAYSWLDTKFGSPQRRAVFGIEWLGGKVHLEFANGQVGEWGDPASVSFDEDRNFTDAELAELGEYLRRLPTVHTIRIHSSTLTDDELRHFHDLPDLSGLSLRGGKVGAEGYRT